MDLDDTTLAYQKQLSPEGRAWLNNRGITDASIEYYKLGEVLTPVATHKRFKGSISIPYLNPDGSVRSIRFRYLHGSLQKYDSAAGVKAHLYNVVATTEPHVFICEGEFDAIILGQLSCLAVGVAGASVFKPEWKYLFTHSSRVSIVFDGDEAGKAGANRIATLLGPVVEDMRMIHLPPGADITDCYLSDVEALKARLA
jgi:DNA primase